MYFNKIKNTINKLKRQLTEWEKLFANHRSGKGVVSKYIKNTYKKITQKIFLIGEGPEKNISPKRLSKWPKNS